MRCAMCVKTTLLMKGRRMWIEILEDSVTFMVSVCITVLVVVAMYMIRMRLTENDLVRSAVNYGLLLDYERRASDKTDEAQRGSADHKQLLKNCQYGSSYPWYMRKFRSPRTQLIVIILLSFVWPVETIVQVIVGIVKYMFGLWFLKTVKAVFLLRE